MNSDNNVKFQNNDNDIIINNNNDHYYYYYVGIFIKQMVKWKFFEILNE